MDGLGSRDVLMPRRLVEIIDRTFRIYRENFVMFVFVVALVTIPITLLGLATQTEETVYNDWYNGEEKETDTPDSVILLGALLYVVVVGGGIIDCTSEYILGRKSSMVDALRKVIRRSFTIILALIAIGIIYLGLMFLLALIFIPTAGSLCVLLPLLLMLAVGYFAASAGLYILPTIILERVGFWLGIRRAMALAKRRFWRNFWFVIGILVIWLVITMAFGQFTVFLLGSSGSSHTILLWVNLAIQIFIIPILPVGLTLMYYDTRIRTEGLDLALMAVETLSPRLSDIPSPVPRDSRVTAQDVKNIVMLLLGIGAVFCSFYALILMLLEASF